MTPEEIKVIPTYKKYGVDKFGNVYNLSKLKVLKPSFDKQGYVRVGIYIGNGKAKTIKVHRLMCLTFIGESNGLDVNHIDGDKKNNNITNLEYCTRSENIIHAFKLGLSKISNKHRESVSKRMSKRVKDVSTGKEYGSLKIASNELGICYTFLKNNLRSDRTNKTNLIWAP